MAIMTIRGWLAVWLGAALIGCAPAPLASTTVEDAQGADAPTVEFPVLGPAPELVGDAWLNTDEPLTLAGLRGKVVLLEMWTFGCVNCRNTLPTLNDWHTRFADQGLVVIGNHYPEFEYEADLGQLKRAVVDLGITYPVVQDNSGDNFFAYRARYWPTIYLIDRLGRLRYTHIGEGAYDETEQAIQTLLLDETNGDLERDAT